MDGQIEAWGQRASVSSSMMERACPDMATARPPHQCCGPLPPAGGGQGRGTRQTAWFCSGSAPSGPSGGLGAWACSSWPWANKRGDCLLAGPGASSLGTSGTPTPPPPPPLSHSLWSSLSGLSLRLSERPSPRTGAEAETQTVQEGVTCWTRWGWGRRGQPALTSRVPARSLPVCLRPGFVLAAAASSRTPGGPGARMRLPSPPCTSPGLEKKLHLLEGDLKKKKIGS